MEETYERGAAIGSETIDHETDCFRYNSEFKHSAPNGGHPKIRSSASKARLKCNTHKVCIKTKIGTSKRNNKMETRDIRGGGDRSGKGRSNLGGEIQARGEIQGQGEVLRIHGEGT
jgi:hypothetical protein